MPLLQWLVLVNVALSSARTYQRIPDRDHDGDTLGDQLIPFNEATMISRCDTTPTCCGFNSYGFMKSACMPLQTRSGYGFYSAVVPGGEPEKTGLSGGSIFLVIFFSLLSLYCLGGAVYNTKMKGTQGMESIPQIEHWRALPGYVKDGLLFIKAKAMGLRG